MKRYEYPSMIARIGAGVTFGVMSCQFLLLDVTRMWPMSLMLLLSGLLLGLRPLDYVVLSDGELWYARMIGKGHVRLDQVVSISSSGLLGRTILRTAHGNVRLKAMPVDYLDFLEQLVAGCPNAKVDSLTLELLDRESEVHRRADRSIRFLHLTANISLTGAAAFALVWLFHTLLMR